MVTQKVHQDPGARDRLSKKRQRNDRNRRAAAYMVVAAVVAVAVAVALNQRGTHSQPGDQPSSLFPISEVLHGTTVDLDTGQVSPLPAGIVARQLQNAAASPDGSRVLFSNSGTNSLFVANIDGTDLHKITRSGVDGYGGQWSPDGTKIVYQARDAVTQSLGNLVVLDLATGTETQITHFDQSPQFQWWFMFPSFVEGGSEVLYQLPRGADQPIDQVWDLWSVPVDGGAPRIVKRNAGWGGMAGASSSMAGHLVYLSPVSAADFSGSRLMLADLGASELSPETLVSGGSIVWPRWSPSGDRIAYGSDGLVYVLELASGAITEIGVGGKAEWIDDHTLSIGTS